MSSFCILAVFSVECTVRHFNINQWRIENVHSNFYRKALERGNSVYLDYIAKKAKIFFKERIRA